LVKLVYLTKVRKEDFGNLEIGFRKLVGSDWLY